MECYRLAFVEAQPIEHMREFLNLATKLQRSFAASVEALNRHRGKTQQEVTVEHVYVNAGGQAVVGTVNTSGMKGNGSSGPAADATQFTHAPEPPLRCAARRGSPCQAPAMANGRCRMHGGVSPGAPIGNKNALKHGRYTAEAIAQRRRLRELLRQMKLLVGKID